MVIGSHRTGNPLSAVMSASLLRASVSDAYGTMKTWWYAVVLARGRLDRVRQRLGPGGPRMAAPGLHCWGKQAVRGLGCVSWDCAQGVASTHGPGVGPGPVGAGGRAVWSEMWDVAAPSRTASTPFTAAGMSG